METGSGVVGYQHFRCEPWR